jgi:glycosyltransferase involved in cell wall biosynthesis
MAKHIVIAVTNDLVTDQRVARIADTLMDTGYKITLVGRMLPTQLPVTREYAVKRFHLLFNKGALFYANYSIRLFTFLLFKKYDAVLANDLDTLPGCFIAAILRRKVIIYDSHEYFTEVPELVNRGFQKKSWLRIEQFILPKIKFAYTVCESIANEYKFKYNTNFNVVRNLPTRKPALQTHTENVLMYQGALNLGRGIELMIETMKYLDNYTLWIAGAGDVEDELKTLVVKLNLSDKVKFLGRIPLNKLHALTSKAKLGLSFEEDLGLNYRFALPNKLFDYIQAQIPVLVSDLPEMQKVVTEFEVGEVLKFREPQKVAVQIMEMLNNDEEKHGWKKHLEKAASELCWENEKMKLITIFEKAIPISC